MNLNQEWVVKTDKESIKLQNNEWIEINKEHTRGKIYEK